MFAGSLDRRWINFEAGVGVGAEATVIPVVTHGLERGSVGHPLTSLHIRSIQTLADVNALMSDVETKLGFIPKATIDSNALITLASQPSAEAGGSASIGTANFSRARGPVLKLPRTEDQTFSKTQADALLKGGFHPHMAHRPNMKPSVDAGHKIVYLTDKKTYRAELRDGDTVLVAKLG